MASPWPTVPSSSSVRARSRRTTSTSVGRLRRRSPPRRRRRTGRRRRRRDAADAGAGDERRRAAGEQRPSPSPVLASSPAPPPMHHAGPPSRPHASLAASERLVVGARLDPLTRPSPPSSTRPSSPNTGSGMSMPWSRMHSANSSSCSRISASCSGSISMLAHRVLDDRLARLLRLLELVVGRRSSSSDDHPALPPLAAELRVGHVDAVVAHALGEVEHRLLAIVRRRRAVAVRRRVGGRRCAAVVRGWRRRRPRSSGRRRRTRRAGRACTARCRRARGVARVVMAASPWRALVESPMRAAERPLRARSIRRRRAVRLPVMRVLVVEDESRLAEAIARGLRAEGFEVDVAHTGPDGLWRALEGVYSAIVLDILLPGLNGYAVCRAAARRGQPHAGPDADGQAGRARRGRGPRARRRRLPAQAVQLRRARRPPAGADPPGDQRPRRRARRSATCASTRRSGAAGAGRARSC